jgi:hypothetical protein
MIKAVKYEVGQETEMLCSDCDNDTMHEVVSVTKLGKITKASCTGCGTESTFVRGVKTAVSGGRKTSASPYDRNRKYRKGQAMIHDTFGRGEVTAVHESQKIDVLFGDTTRKLIHSQQ